MSGYTKLFSDILTSSIWNEDSKTRILWITILAMCDATGYVRSSRGSLSVMARLSNEEVNKALEILESPDADSRSEAFEGRRLERVEGGWLVLNYEFYRNKLSKDAVAVSNRERQRKYRENHKSNGGNVTSRDTASVVVDEDSSKEGECEGEQAKLVLTKDHVERIMDSWNTFSKPAGLTPIKRMTSNRKKHYKARLGDFAGEEDAMWIAIKEQLENLSDFAKGKNDRNWVITFDWLFKAEDNLTKFCDGNYRHKGTAR